MGAEFDFPLERGESGHLDARFDAAPDFGGDAITNDSEDTLTDIPDTVPEPKIAGVTLTHISDQVPYHSAHQEYDHTQALVKSHGIAREEFGREGFRPSIRGRGDKRMATLSVWDNPRGGSPGHDAPFFSFLLDDRLLRRVEEETARKGSELTINELLRIGLDCAEGAVEPDFSTDAMNAINAAYYSSPVAFESEGGVATMFAENRPLNYALGAMLAKESGAEGTLRVKELCSGRRTAHWGYEARGALDAGVSQVAVTLTDFVAPPVAPEAVSAAVRVQAERYSLFEGFPDLPENPRFNAIITTYGFDSVWQPEDVHLSKLGDTWYQTLYRVKVADWNPRRHELLEAIREGRALPDAIPQDYDGIYVETAMEPIDINAHPFGSHILEHGLLVTNFPGGLIKRVLNAFETQLTEGGIFVSCDVGDFGLIERDAFLSDGISGVAARYRADDYLLAQKILQEEYDLDVQLLGLDELARDHLPPGWQAQATELEQNDLTTTPTHGIMIVKRRIH